MIKLGSLTPPEEKAVGVLLRLFEKIKKEGLTGEVGIRLNVNQGGITAKRVVIDCIEK